MYNLARNNMVLDANFSHFVDTIKETANAEASLATLKNELSELNHQLNQVKKNLTLALKAKDHLEKEPLGYSRKKLEEEWSLLLEQKVGVINKLEAFGYEETLSSIQLEDAKPV